MYESYGLKPINVPTFSNLERGGTSESKLKKEDDYDYNHDLAILKAIYHYYFNHGVIPHPTYSNNFIDYLEASVPNVKFRGPALANKIVMLEHHFLKVMKMDARCTITRKSAASTSQPMDNNATNVILAYLDTMYRDLVIANERLDHMIGQREQVGCPDTSQEEGRSSYVVADLPRVEVFESPYGDTLGDGRLREDQTLVVLLPIDKNTQMVVCELPTTSDDVNKDQLMHECIPLLEYMRGVLKKSQVSDGVYIVDLDSARDSLNILCGKSLASSFVHRDHVYRNIVNDGICFFGVGLLGRVSLFLNVSLLLNTNVIRDFGSDILGEERANLGLDPRLLLSFDLGTLRECGNFYTSYLILGQDDKQCFIVGDNKGRKVILGSDFVDSMKKEICFGFQKVLQSGKIAFTLGSMSKKAPTFSERITMPKMLTSGENQELVIPELAKVTGKRKLPESEVYQLKRVFAKIEDKGKHLLSDSYELKPINVPTFSNLERGGISESKLKKEDDYYYDHDLAILKAICHDPNQGLNHDELGGIPYNSKTPQAIWSLPLTWRPIPQPNFTARVGVSDSDKPQGTRPTYNPSRGHNNPVSAKHGFGQ
ncbi:hypothetical protein CQW23_17897 [Capsicum baccatum]|uniref:Uncharacterized protein n=1 Tax=Capsicum baccatum TaxID=33114 RepID=A0A2G2WF62_CAPBA|nr:hypothetical protein CQW23_17897 [Capsicum baccatum]